MDSTSTARVPASAEASRDHRPKQRVTSPVPARQTLDRLYRPVFQPLAAVEARLTQELQCPYPPLVPLLRHGTQLGGKRLRPAMLLLAGAATGRLSDEHVVLGAVIEMVHTATLIHDDVLDEATTRRHVPTVNAKWDEHTSILLGDYLFAQSFRLAATLSSTAACRQIGEAARLVCEGELRQVLGRNDLDLDEQDYLGIIRAKTAELCRVACQLGSDYAGADAETTNRLAQFGDAVGIAFQIADDYLDLWGDHHCVGKTLGTDIEQGKLTLPLIRMLETADSALRGEILRILAGPAEQRVQRIRPLLASSDARQYTMETAERFRDLALASLDSLDDSDAKHSLRAIAEFSVARRF
jgi:octaprenyl-diphosphate synthase